MAERDANGRFISSGNKKEVSKTGGYEWRGGDYTKAMQGALSKRLDIVSTKVVVDIQRSFPGSGVANATAAERRENASQPGEIPHVQFGFLRDNIGWMRVTRLVRRIGTGIGGTLSVPYAASLEKGNDRGMQKRPYMRPGIRRNARLIKKSLTAPVKLKGFNEKAV